MTPHIYIEGPDGAGKTTYAQFLMRSGNYRYDKWSLPLPEEDRIQRAVDAIESTTPTIFDRGWIGHLIYGTTLDQGAMSDLPSKDQCLSMIKYMTDNGGQFIYMDADIDVLVKRIGERGDPYIKGDVKGQLKVIQANYMEFLADMRRWRIPYYSIRTNYLTY